ncbi:DMT family transporter, partial [Alkalihalophilus pseudofirmus]
LDKSLLFWSLTFYLAVFGTLLAFYIQLVMIRKTSPTRVGLLMGTEPIFATLFAIMLGDEKLSIQGWIGGFLIVIATYYGRYVELKYRTKVVNSEV